MPEAITKVLLAKPLVTGPEKQVGHCVSVFFLGNGGLNPGTGMLNPYVELHPQDKGKYSEVQFAKIKIKIPCIP